MNREAASILCRPTFWGEAGENDALRWITANPAWALGIDERVGTLYPGKMADIVFGIATPSACMRVLKKSLSAVTSSANMVEAMGIE